MTEGEGTDAARSTGRPGRCLLRLVLVAWALSTSACATWQGRPHVLDTPLGPRDQVRLWVGGKGHQVHGVQVRGDSVIAVPFIRAPDCDSCALHVARADVDSVQVWATDWRGSLFAAVAWAPVFYLLYVLSRIPHD